MSRVFRAEHFCCGNSLSLLLKVEKLIQIPVLISVLFYSTYKGER